MKKKIVNELYLELDPEIQSAIERKLYEYYKQEKENSILFTPLLSCILISGNHFQPIISFQESHALSVLSNELNSTYIFPGYTIDIDYITKENFEKMLQIISLYHSLFGQSVKYDSTVQKETTYFIDLFERIKTTGIDNFNPKFNRNIFEQFNKMYSIGLSDTLEKIENIINKQNKETKSIIILPREDVFRCNYSFSDNGIDETAKNIETVKKFADKYQARIFLSSNNNGKDTSPEGIALRLYENLFSNSFPIIKGIDDFSTEYSKIVMEEAKNAIYFDQLVIDIAAGNYGSTNTEIIENIDKIKTSSTSIKQQTQPPTLQKKT